MLTGGFSPEVLMARFSFLTDAEIAAVLSYCRKVFGESAGAVTAEQVTRVRAQVQ